MDILHAHGCGIDVAREIPRGLLPASRADRRRCAKRSRRVDTMTADLQALAAWLTSEGVTHVGTPNPEPAFAIVPSLPNYGFVIDLRKCIGCHACTIACKAEHDIPVGANRCWVKTVEKGTFPDTQRLFLPVSAISARKRRA